MLPVWCKFHVESLFKSEDIENEKGVPFSCLWCHDICGNLENQTSTSKNHILGLKGDTDVKLALISITLAVKKNLSALLVAFVRFQF